MKKKPNNTPIVEVLSFESNKTKMTFKVRLLQKRNKYAIFVTDGIKKYKNRKVFESTSFELASGNFHKIVSGFTNSINETKLKQDYRKVVKKKKEESELKTEIDKTALDEFKEQAKKTIQNSDSLEVDDVNIF